MLTCPRAGMTTFVCWCSHADICRAHAQYSLNLSCRPRPMLCLLACVRARMLIITLGQNPKKLKDEVMDYVNKKRDELDIDESKWVSGIGVLCFVFGLLLIVVRFIVGAIVPPAPSRLHKNAAAPRKLFT